MQRPNYQIPTNPVYNPNIPALLDSDPASATDTFNPVIQKLVDNTHAVHDLATKNAGTTNTLELHNTDPTAHADIRQAINAAANPPTMTQAQAEAGTNTAIQSVTAQRLRQAANSAIDARVQNSTLGTTNAWHAISGTAGPTAAKVISLSADQPPFVRQLGTIIIIRFTTANTAATPTMNIGATGAANIRHAGANIGGAGLWQANQEVIFVWDNTGWNIINPMIRGTMVQPSTALPGSPSIGTRPAATANNTQIADTAWVRSRIAEASEVETGTFIPNFGGTFTVAAQQAVYTRVGRAVHVSCAMHLHVSQNETSLNYLQLFGLPFQPMVGNQIRVLGAINFPVNTAVGLSNLPTGARNLLLQSNGAVHISSASAPTSFASAPPISNNFGGILSIVFNFNFVYLTN